VKERALEVDNSGRPGSFLCVDGAGDGERGAGPAG
jgi:hypothetical protein